MTLASSTSIETATITGELDSEAITDTESVDFTVGDADAGVSSVAADPGEIEANGVSSSTITVTVRDAQGNVRTGGGDQVFVTTNAGELSNEDEGADGTEIPANDEGDGTYTVTLTSSTQVETATITAYLGTDDEGDEIGTSQVDFTAQTVDGANSSVSASPLSVTANGTDATLLTMVVRDGDDVAITGLVEGDFAFNGTGGATAANFSNEGGGTYTIDFTNETIEDVTIQVDVVVDGDDDVDIGTTDEISFVGQVADAGNSSVESSPGNVLANGTSQSTITVTVRDADNEPIEGMDVFLDQGGGGSTISGGGAGTTNGSGVAEFTVTSETAETVTYTATADPEGDDIEITQQPEVVFQQAFYTISGTIDDGDGGFVENVSVVASGDHSQTVTTNEAGTYELTNVAHGSDVTITPTLVDYGFEPVKLDVNDVTGDVSDQNFTGMTDPVVTTVTVEGDEDVTIPADGNTTSGYTATVLDQYGAEMGGEAVTWSLQAPVTGVSIDGTTGEVTVTDEAGEGIFTVVATSDTNNGVTGTLEVTLSLDASVVTTIEVDGDEELSIPTEGNTTTSTYTVAVLDQYGAEMAGEGVTWTLDEATTGVSIDPATGEVTINDEAGEGTFIVVATSDTDGGVTGALEVTLSLDDPVVTSIEVDGDEELSIPTEGNTTTSMYTAEVLDQYGAEMGGEEVSWSLQAPVTGVSIDETSGQVTITDEAGEGTFTVVATSDTDNGVTGTLEVTLSLDASVVTTIEVNGDEELSIPTEGNTTTSTYTAQVLDQYGSEMGGEDVTWNLDEVVTGVSIDETSGQVTITDEAGEGTFTVVATSDTDGGVTGTLEVTMSLDVPVVTNIEVDGDEELLLPTTSNTTASTYTAQVLDQYGSEMGDEEVTWSLQSPVTGVSIDETSGQVTVTDEAGEETFTVVATSDEDGDVSGTLEVTLSLDASVVTTIEVNGDEELSIPTEGNTTTSTYAAAVLDQYGAAMGAETVTWTLDEAVTGVSIDLATGEVTINDEAGEGTFIVVATSETDTNITGELEVTMSLDTSVVTSLVVTGDETVTLPTAGNTTTADYTAEVLDQYGTEMGGEDVTWSLQAPVTGVSIDEESGQVTVTDEAGEGTFTVVATSDTDNGVTGTLEVTLSLDDPVVTNIEVNGDEELLLPTTGNTTTSTYAAQVLDQYGSEMAGEDVTWNLDEVVTGVSIDGTTGEVTVTDEAEVGDFTVVATSDTDDTITGTLEVMMSLDTSVITSIEVDGDEELSIPTEGNTTTSMYTAEVLDQYGSEMAGEDVTWSLDEVVTGVSIDGTSGEVMVTDEAEEGSFTVVATSDTNNGVTGTLEVTMSLDDPVVTSIEVDGDEEIMLPTTGNTTTSTYTAQVLDQYGSEMGGEDVTWNLDEVVTGVSIDETSGQVTITDEAGEGTFIVVATSDTDGNISGTLEVTLSLDASVVTTIEVNGDEELSIPTEGNTTTSTYTADVLDQYGSEMAGEDVTWSLDEVVTGVSIDGTTSEVTITDEAEVGDFTVVATSDTNNGVTGTLEVTLSLDDPVVTSIEVDGDEELSIPTEGNTTTSMYTAEVLDQYGAEMGGEEVSWSLQAPVTGVSIDETSGQVTITDEAGEGTFTVVATSDTDNGVTGTLEVTLSLDASVVATIEVDGDEELALPTEGNTTTSMYTAEVLDQYGAEMGGEDVVWSLDEVVTGVSIDEESGQVTVTDEAGEETFTVVATSDTNNGVTGTLEVTMSVDDPVVTSIEVDGDEELLLPTTGNTTTSTYTAHALDQYGAEMIGEDVAWSLDEAVTGVSIDTESGQVTVTDEAGEGNFTVVATSDTDGDVSGTLEVTLSLDDPVVMGIEVDGDEELLLPTTGNTTTSTYTAQVLDQYGAEMGAEDVTWSLDEAVTGVSIDEESGQVTVTDEAGEGTFTVVATSDTNNGVTGTLEVTLSFDASVVTTVEVDGDEELALPTAGNTTTSTYTAAVLDQYGSEMGGEEVSWNLQAPVTGVSIDEESGQVTVTDEAGEETFTVVATSDTDDTITGTLEVTMSLDDPVVTSIEVDGDEELSIPTEGNTTTSTYAAAVLDQYDAEMGDEEVTWSLQSPVTGVSIDETSGQVTVTDEAGEGTFTVVATSDTNNGVISTLEVTLSLDASVVTSIEVDGGEELSIPTEGNTATSTYTAEVLDQYGSEMAGEDVTWSLAEAVAGVSIDPATGEVTINDEAGESTFIVVATSDTDGGVTGTLEVTLSLDAPVVTMIEVDGDEELSIPTEGNTTTSMYTAEVLDQYGSEMAGEDVTWSLAEAVTGVAINETTGVVTVRSTASEEDEFTVVATSAADGDISGDLLVAMSRNLTLSGIPISSAILDQPYESFTVSATGGDEDYTYSLVGTWPSGIEIDAGTGEISGTPSESGIYEDLSVRVMDGNNIEADLDTFTLTVKPATPTIENPTESRFVNEYQVEEVFISGMAEGADDVRITIADGNNTIVVTAPVTDGEYELEVDISDLDDGWLSIDVVGIGAGDNESESAGISIIKDTAAPDLAVSGRLPAVDSNPTITGTSDEPEGSQVAVTIDGETYTGVVDAEGYWSVIVTEELADGEYNFEATITDEAGNNSSESGDLQIDTTAPAINSITLVGDPEEDVESVQFEVAFSEYITGFSLEGFSLTTTGNAAGNIAGFTGEDDIYIIEVDQIDGTGSLQLDFIWEEGSEIEDLAGNTISTDYTDGDVHNVNRVGSVDLANSGVSAEPSELAVGNNATVTITLRDANDNALTGVDESEIDLSFGNSEANIVSDSFNEAEAGVYTIEVSNETAEEITVIASVLGVELDDQPVITFTPGNPATFVKVSGDGQTQPTLSTLEDSLAVRVNDQFGNAVIGESVLFKLMNSPDLSVGSAFTQDSVSQHTVLTNSTGLARTAFRLGDSGGDYVISAHVVGNTGLDTLLFTATALETRPDPSVIDTVNTVVFNGDMNTFMYAEPNGTLNNLESYSAEIWVLPHELTGEYELFNKESNDNGNKQFKIWGEDNTIYARINLKDGSAVTLSSENTFELAGPAGEIAAKGSTNSDSPNNDAEPYRWTHLALSVDDEEKRADLYKNGFRVDAAEFEGDVQTGNAQLEMGRGLKGEIHEARVWNTAIGRPQIQSRMTQILKGNEDNLVFYHTFDDNGDTATDLTPNANHLHLGESVDRQFSIRGIPNVEMLENESYIMAFKGLDEYGNPLKAIITQLPSHGKLYQVTGDGSQIGEEITSTPATLTDSENRAWYTPDAYYNGNDNMEFILEDIYGNSAEATRQIRIHQVNNAPVVSFEDSRYISFDQKDSLNVDLNKFVLDHDLEDEPEDMTWSAQVLVDDLNAKQAKEKKINDEESENSQGVSTPLNSYSASGDNSGKFTITQTNTTTNEKDSLIIKIDNQVNTATITSTRRFEAFDVPVLFTVVDPSQLSNSDTLFVTVNPVYDPPSLFSQWHPTEGDTIKINETGDRRITFDWEPSLSDEGNNIEYIFSIWNDDGEHESYSSISDTLLTLQMDKSILEFDQRYTWRIEATDGIDTTQSMSEKQFYLAKEMPLVYSLSQNYPNPFNNATTINYLVPVDSDVRVTIYDILGRRVQQLVDQNGHQAGQHSVNWNIRGLASGTYIYRMEAISVDGEHRFIKTKKMMLVK